MNFHYINKTNAYFCKKNMMFSQGQLVFALFFCVSFIIVMIYVYRRDLILHKIHYKGTSKILLGFAFFIGLLFLIKFFMKK
jgi:hypothetical protein